LHYHSLNRALQDIAGIEIKRDEHLSTFDGLPTTKKLRILTNQGRITEDMHNSIWRSKQEKTLDVINEKVKPNKKILNTIIRLKKEGYRLVCCTNSIRETAKLMLIRSGILEYLDFFIANTDVKTPKPHPEMYLRAIVKLGLRPRECVIVEDSHHGREAAIESGAHLCPVRDLYDVTYGNIVNVIDKSVDLNINSKSKPKWQGSNTNVVIPLAGSGKSFENVGYTFPKPIIDINGKPMIQEVFENLNMEANFIFIVKKEHYTKYNLKYLLNLMAPNCKIIIVNKDTEGAAQTVLLAEKHINNENPLVIANGDQIIDWNSNEFFYSMQSENVDGGIIIFNATHPRWSFVKMDENGFVTEVAEKKVISNNATAGVYYYAKGKDFVKFTKQMINKNIRTNNEFYVVPAFNEFIKSKKKIKAFKVDKVWGLGTPEDLQKYMSK